MVLALTAMMRFFGGIDGPLHSRTAESKKGDMRRYWIAVENKWFATRYGLNAIYLRTPGGKRRPLATELDVLVNRLLPVAKDLGDERY